MIAKETIEEYTFEIYQPWLTSPTLLPSNPTLSRCRNPAQDQAGGSQNLSRALLHPPSPSSTPSHPSPPNGKRAAMGLSPGGFRAEAGASCFGPAGGHPHRCQASGGLPPRWRPAARAPPTADPCSWPCPQSLSPLAKLSADASRPLSPTHRAAPLFLLTSSPLRLPQCRSPAAPQAPPSPAATLTAAIRGSASPHPARPPPTPSVAAPPSAGCTTER